VPVTGSQPGLHLIAHDVALDRRLPFGDEFFDVVTMLAVFEHLDRHVLLDLVREIRRVLVPKGSFVMTTPARWTAGILKLMSTLTLVSRDEVDEHEAQYSRQQIVELLAQGGFDPKQIEAGTFELGMNLWARARRPV
jgi:SAM-dependent methyltransferase